MTPHKPTTGFAQSLFSLRNRHFFALDLLIFCITPIAALALRTDGLNAVTRYADALGLYTLVAIVLRWIVFIPFGLYSRYWRHASTDEIVQIFLAVTTATLMIAVVFFGILRPFGLLADDFPRSIPFLDGILVLPAVGGVRFSVRLAGRMRQRRRNRLVNSTRVVVLGAGDAGAMIVKEMQANPQLGLEPVAFLDDDPQKHRVLIHGVPVVGDRYRIREVVEDYKVQQAIIAMPTAPGKTIRELTRLCQEANLPVKTVPGIFELLNGSVTVSQLRPVAIEDLLRREPVVIDMTKVAHMINGQRVLVTGAGGSIGSELCRQIARHNPARLVLLGHGENSIFEICNELSLGAWERRRGARKYGSMGAEEQGSGGDRESSPQHLRTPAPIHAIIADIRDEMRLRAVFERERPQIVFHAAAHKHVPLMEENVEDAVTNNILGTRNVVEMAIANGVERFVLISTDKAVNPTSVMGATKRVAELIVQQAAQETGKCFVAVRFGNVLDSRGSVVRVFKQQIAQGGPVTVTHPEARRYFMTIPEAVQLVLQAAALGKGGEIFVLDMGEPMKIVDLARDLIRLSGLTEGEDIDIVFTGLRPGEKLSEDLFLCGEEYSRTAHEKILVVRNGAEEQGSRGEFSPVHPHRITQAQLDALIAAAKQGKPDEVRRLLQELVPEYRPAMDG